MWYQTMGIDDLIVDSIYLQFESDSDQPLEVYWSKSSRPFNRHRLPFSHDGDWSVIIDRSSSFFCESCDAYVGMLDSLHSRYLFIHLNLPIVFFMYQSVLKSKVDSITLSHR